MAQILPSNTFCVAKWIVSPTASDGTHTTIQAAINAASSGDSIFVREGTYTENLTLKAGVNIVSARGAGKTTIVNIVGTATHNTAGIATISGVQLQTNGSFCLANTGTLASTLNIIDSVINCSNSTGINFSNSNAASIINISLCTGNLNTTGIGLYTMSSIGTMTIDRCTITNPGASLTASTNSAGIINKFYCNSTFALSTSSTGVLNIFHCTHDCSAINTTALTTAGTGTSTVRHSSFLSGTASAISIGAGTTLKINMCVVNSSNTNAITGAGTINYSNLAFNGTSSTINTTTQVSSGPLKTLTAQTFTASGAFTYTPTAALNYVIVELVGGGGGSGGIAATTASVAAGGGGGAGGYAKFILTAAQVGVSLTGSVGIGGTAGTSGANPGGNGGNTTLATGAAWTASGGVGGTGGASTANDIQASGAGGTVTSGTGTILITATGGGGGVGFGTTTSGVIGCCGGSSLLGLGGQTSASQTSNTLTAGIVGSGKGSGAGGPIAYGTNSAAAGTAGTLGVAIFTEFTS